MAYNENTSPSDIYMGPSSAESPGGFIFGPQGWQWGQQKPKGITFFLDGTAKVYDQWGRPIKGTIDSNNKKLFFAERAPSGEETDLWKAGVLTDRVKTHATHAQVVAALEAEKVDWQSLTCAGFPQLSYEELKKLKKLPTTPIKELKKIKDTNLRKAALKVRREADEVRAAELREEEDEG